MYLHTLILDNKYNKQTASRLSTNTTFKHLAHSAGKSANPKNADRQRHHSLSKKKVSVCLVLIRELKELYVVPNSYPRDFAD